MLNRENEPLKKWFNRVMKILIILIVFSLGYYLYHVYIVKNTGFSWGVFLTTLYSSTLRAHLWYLYLYIAYLMAIPFLKALVKNLENKYFIYMFLIAVFTTGVLPSLEYLITKGNVSINGNIKISWLLNTAVLYPCLGYFLHNRVDMQSIKKRLPIIWLLNLAGIFLSSYMTFYKGRITGALNESESQAFHGSCTFGIYLLHLFFKDIFLWGRFSTIYHGLINAGVNYMVAIWMVCFVVLIVAYMITWIISKIPIMKKLVGFK